MTGAAFTVRPLEPGDRAWVLEMVRGWGGTDYMVSRGRVIPATDLPGFCAVRPDGGRVGLAVYEPAGREWQLVVLEAVERFVGIGTALVAPVRAAAMAAGCRRLWLVTTNDNLDALRFYQRRGFEVVAVHRGLREIAERLKPSIPLVGKFKIPILSEVELEMRLS
ncbi:MAG: GNAT family N-acetyltransferase [Thermoleophilia bacterium]|nr:GNAT family N-acetyltransferase [Thermoleophilia bacterium]